MNLKVISEINMPEDEKSDDRIYDLSQPGVYRFVVQGMDVDVFVSIKGSKDSILWCGQSAIVEAQLQSLPVFHRISWVDDFDCSVVIFNDPTLYLQPGLLCGWYQGTQTNFAVTAISRVCDVIKRSINSEARSVYYGSSAGGFWALMMAAIDKSICMAEIPQMDMFKYPYVRHREFLLDRCYREVGLDPMNYTHRLRTVDWFKKISSLPKEIHIFQNINDIDHTESQLKPFQQEMAEFSYSDLHVTMYGVPSVGNGHKAMDKGQSVIELRRLLFT